MKQAIVNVEGLQHKVDQMVVRLKIKTGRHEPLPAEIIRPDVYQEIPGLDKPLNCSRPFSEVWNFS